MAFCSVGEDGGGESRRGSANESGGRRGAKATHDKVGDATLDSTEAHTTCQAVGRTRVDVEHLEFASRLRGFA